MSDDEALFSRWSRRKRQAAREQPEPAPTEPPAEAVPKPQSAEEEAALLERLQLPVPESLKEGDDFSVFMKAGVPDFLRRRALRVLWRSNPVLANLDGLNDYDEDFTSPELTKKVLATAYKVGRGILIDEPPPDAAQESEEESETGASPEESRLSEAESPAHEPDSPEATVAAKTATTDESGELPFRPSRMRFDT